MEYFIRFILFTAKDGGTMLREKQLREMFKLDAEISGQMIIRDSSTGQELKYSLKCIFKEWAGVIHFVN